MPKGLSQTEVAAFCRAARLDPAGGGAILAAGEALFDSVGHLHGLTKNTRPVVDAVALMWTGRGRETKPTILLRALHEAAPGLTAPQRRQVREALRQDPPAETARRIAALVELAAGVDASSRHRTRIAAVLDDGRALEILLDGDVGALEDAAGALAAARRWNATMARPVQAVRIASDRSPRQRLLEPAHTVSEAIRRLVQRELDQFFSRQHGLHDPNDVEFVHELRVALRRLRSIERLFRKVLGDRGKPLRQAAGRLADALAEVRDADVFAEFLRRYESESSGDAAAFARRLVADETRRRRMGVERLRTAFEPAQLAALRSQVDPGTSEALGLRPEDGEAGRLIGRLAPKLLKRRLRKVLQRGGRLEDLSAHRLHRVRIQCKRMRYSAEMLGDLYEGGLAGLIHAMEDLQDELGEVHDCDVYTERVSTAADRRSADPVSQRGAEALIGRLARRRRRALRRAEKKWGAFVASHAVDALHKAIESPREP
jgi:CHAD domain-containing protein